MVSLELLGGCYMEETVKGDLLLKTLTIIRILLAIQPSALGSAVFCYICAHQAPCLVCFFKQRSLTKAQVIGGSFEYSAESRGTTLDFIASALLNKTTVDDENSAASSVTFPSTLSQNVMKLKRLHGKGKTTSK